MAWQKLKAAFNWVVRKIKALGGLLGRIARKLRSIISRQPAVRPGQGPIDQDSVDFSSRNIGDQQFRTKSYARIYEMSAKRKWQWIRNLIFLKKWQQPKKNENDSAEILAQFSKKEELFAGTDLSFNKNTLPLVPGDAYVNQESFEEYLGHLAHHRHYHLFAQVMFSMLKRNSVSTIDLLKNLIHARDQITEKQLCDENYTLLYVKEKSQQWIGSLMCRILPKAPNEIRAIDWSKPGYIGHGRKFLLCDDICYTGTQLCTTLDQLAQENKGINLTLVIGRMSVYALSEINGHIKNIKARDPGFKINIVVGEMFHTVSAQLDGLPFPPTKNERHIIKQILSSNYAGRYELGDFRRKPLLTTGWKKPDYVSSYHQFLGFEKKGPDPILVSSALLSKLPSEPITFFSNANPAPKMQVAKAFITGPEQRPYISSNSGYIR